MKSINELEQEAKEARDNAIFLHCSESPLSQDIVDSFINAAVAMVTYQLALGMEDADQIWNESGTKVISEKLPEVLQAQKERDSDGWIDWGGGDRRPTNKIVDVKTRDGKTLFNVGSYTVRWAWAKKLSEQEGTQIFCYPDDDIIAYRIAK